jgi:septum formation protein
MKNLFLASNSPRRKELLSLFGWPFEVIPADIDERQLPGESPKNYVRRLANWKANAIAEKKNGLVIAADTIVVDGDDLLGKPVDDADARQMLVRLRGRTHQVYSGLAIIDTETGQSFNDVCCTDVPMRAYSDDEIDTYIATGDPLDKAGSYAIQHPGFHPVDELRGCFSSVMGLPLCHLAVGLRMFNLSIPDDLPKRCQALLDYSCPNWPFVLGNTT